MRTAVRSSVDDFGRTPGCLPHHGLSSGLHAHSTISAIVSAATPGRGSEFGQTITRPETARFGGHRVRLSHRGGQAGTVAVFGFVVVGSAAAGRVGASTAIGPPDRRRSSDATGRR